MKDNSPAVGPFKEQFVKNKSSWDGQELQLREKNLQQFSEMGFPSIKDEDWKYTNLAPLTKESFVLSEAAPSPLPDAIDSEDKDEALLVFVNGQFHSEASQIPSIKGVEVTPLTEIKKLSALDFQYDYRPDAFRAMNGAFLQNGLDVKVKKDTQAKVRLVYLNKPAENAEQHPMFHSRVHVLVESGAEAVVIEEHRGFSEAKSLSTSVFDAEVKANAQLEWLKWENEGLEAFHMSNAHIEVDQDARFQSHLLYSGGRLNRQNLDVHTRGTSADITLNGVYLLAGKQHTDFHTAVYHNHPHGRSHQLYKGLLNEKARTVFNGKIRIEPQSQKVDSSQLNKTLVLDSRAEVDTKPELEVYADDVVATHGAAIGQLQSEQLFYLQSRGIPKNQAQQILARAYVEEVVYRGSKKAAHTQVGWLAQAFSGESGQRLIAEASDQQKDKS